MGSTIEISNIVDSTSFPLNYRNGSNFICKNIFLEFLPEWNIIFPKLEGIYSESFLTMLASEKVLSKEWDTPEEDEAWADL